MPLLSITMPTRNRPELFERALTSVVRAMEPVAAEVEIAVSDGSSDEASGRVVERLLAGWPGGHCYVWNRPALDMVQNLNRALELGHGTWVHQLHDDDYLLPGAGLMVDALRAATAARERVVLFGVRIVDVHGTPRHRQRRLPAGHLDPAAALRRLMGNSSFVRLPGVVVHREAYEQVGRFDVTAGSPTDLDLWVRLFGRYGLRCVPDAVCAYTVHEGAATTGMWHAGTIESMCRIFDGAVTLGVVPEHRIRRWETDYFHQFILAGAVRHLRHGRRAQAREVLELFRLPDVRRLGPSPRWMALRAAVTALTAGAR